MMLRLLASLGFALGVLAVAPAALAEPLRILVAIGSNAGLPAERTLRFADNDAKRVRDVMVSLGGVRSEHAHLLRDPTRAELYAALDRAKRTAARSRPEEVTLFFYFSGHGDRDAIHLPGDRVLVSELSARLADIPAGLRIAVTDACRSTRDKGFGDAEPFAISTALIPQARGQVWLHSSSDGEAAQESDDLEGAIFTQAWLSGLRGAADANGDMRVTLDESFAFAQAQTLMRSSKSSGVLQKPEAVLNLRESAPVVLTETATSVATIALPPARDTHFLVYSPSAKSVISEVWAIPERPLLLQIPPGRYVIQRRATGAASAAQIALSAGEQRTLREPDFSATTLDVVARKGDDVEAPTTERGAREGHELSVGYDAGWSARTGLAQGPRATYAYAWGALAVTVGGAAELSGRSLTERNEDLVAGYGRVGVELRGAVLSRLTLRAGAGARAGVVVQTLTSSAGDEAQTERAFAAGPEAVLAARLDLARAWFADLAGTGALPFVREEGELKPLPGAAATLALGARF